jgi:hypothetical protein
MVGISLPSFLVPCVIGQIYGPENEDGNDGRFIIAVMAPGATVEFQTSDEKLVKSLRSGSVGVASGRIESSVNGIALIVTKFEERPASLEETLMSASDGDEQMYFTYE